MEREHVVARSPKSRLGIMVQAVGFFFAFFHPPHHPIAWSSLRVLIGAALAVTSFSFAVVAIRHLGKQWSFQARTIEGHQLVTTGPYAIVRHPIYTAMMGFLVGASLVFGAFWWTRALACVFGALGTRVRVKAEDALMAQTFGAQFDDYRRRVGAVVPRL